MSSFSTTLKAYKKLINLSDGKFAKKLEIDRRTFIRWRDGDIKPSKEKIENCFSRLILVAEELIQKIESILLEIPESSNYHSLETICEVFCFTPQQNKTDIDNLRHLNHDELIICLQKRLDELHEARKLVTTADYIPTLPQISEALTPPSPEALSPSQNRLGSSSAAVAYINWEWVTSNDSKFFGRKQELEKLEYWIVSKKCRLVAVLGMGGIGKTTLTTKFVQENTALKTEFDYIIWQSLRDAPKVQAILNDLIKSLSNQQDVTDMEDTFDEQVQRLLKYLCSCRCLLILDNMESVLQGGEFAGTYRNGYEQYGSLIKQLSETSHQSCLLLTSREKPREVSWEESFQSFVRSLSLSPLSVEEGQQIFNTIGKFSGSDKAWQNLIEIYNGNPLVLRLVALNIKDTSINTQFCDIEAFLDKKKYIFRDLTKEVLDGQFERLLRSETEIVYWLAINRKPMSAKTLEEDILSLESKAQISSTLQSLHLRLLLEKTDMGFTLQPVLIEYLTNQFIKRIATEIIEEKIEYLNTHVLLKATMSDYIREAQIRTILEPLTENLVLEIGKKALEDKLNKLLVKLREDRKPGYAAGNIIDLLSQMESNLTGYDFSNLHISQAYLQGINLHDVNFAYAKFDRCAFNQPLGRTYCVTYSPDGKRLAAGDSHDKIYLWDTSTGQKTQTFDGHTNWIRSIAFSPDGKLMASASDDETVRLWNAESGKCLDVLKRDDLLTINRWARSVSISADGLNLAVGYNDGAVRIWDINDDSCTRSRIKNPDQHENTVWSVAFAPQGKVLCTGCHKGLARLWDIQTGDCLKTFKTQEQPVYSVCFSPDGMYLAGTSGACEVIIWALASGEIVHVLSGHRKPVRSVAFSADGLTLASGSEDKTIRWWDVRTGECLHVFQDCHANEIWSVAFNPSLKHAQFLAACGDDRKIRIWNTATRSPIYTWEGYTNKISTLALSSDNKLLAAGNEDHLIRLWSVENAKVSRIFSEHRNQVWSVALSPNEKLLASGSDDNTVRIWNVNRGQCVHLLKGHMDFVYSVAFSPDGKILASSGSNDKTIKLWDVQSGQLLADFDVSPNSVWPVVFSPDGEVLACGRTDGVVELKRVTDGKVFRTMEGHHNSVLSLSFNPHQSILASAGYDQNVRLWDIDSGECLRELEGHTYRIRSVAFSPNGNLLASGGDNTVRLWNVANGNFLKRFRQNDERIRAVAFTHDGTKVVSGSNDGTVRFWDIASGDCVKTLRTDRPYERMNITGITGLDKAEIANLKELGAITRDA